MGRGENAGGRGRGKERAEEGLGGGGERGGRGGEREEERLMALQRVSIKAAFS